DPGEIHGMSDLWREGCNLDVRSGPLLLRVSRDGHGDELLDDLPGFGVAEADGAIETRGGDDLAIAAVAEGVDGADVVQLRHLLGRLGLVDADLALAIEAAACREPVAILAELQSEDPARHRRIDTDAVGIVTDNALYDAVHLVEP